MIEESELSKLKDELEKRKNQIGLVGVGLNVRQMPGDSFSGSISTDWKEMDINYGRDLELVPDNETREFIQKKRIESPLRKTGEDLVEHESGHRENRVGSRRGCPHDLRAHELIKDAIAKGLKETGKQGFENYVTNAFEDILDNVNCRRYTDFSGQTIFWNNQGLTNSQNGKFSPFYEAFVRANLLLGSEAGSHTLLRRFFGNKDALSAVKRFMGDLTSILGEQKSCRMHEKEGFRKLFDIPQKEREQLWANLGYKFAAAFGPLLEGMPEQRMFGSSEGDENSDEQNPFDKEMKVPANRQEIVYGRYKEGRGLALHRDKNEQLFDLYKAISKEVRVETSHYTSSQSIPLVHFGRRFMKEDELKPRFRGVGIREDGSLGLKTTKHCIEHPVSYKNKPHKFPKFKLALMDRSGSMTESSDGSRNIGDKSCIPWGDKSKYHFALKGYFGIDNFFERQGIAPYVENCVLGFSGESAIKGSAEDAAKSLLVMPSGGTSLDIGGLERELEEGALVISISDGEFSLDEETKEKLEKKIAMCDYAHIQIGADSLYSNYLREKGVQVINVKGDEDLSQAMVSFVSKHYRNLQGEAK